MSAGPGAVKRKKVLRLPEGRKKTEAQPWDFADKNVEKRKTPVLQETNIGPLPLPAQRNGMILTLDPSSRLRTSRCNTGVVKCAEVAMSSARVQSSFAEVDDRVMRN